MSKPQQPELRRSEEVPGLAPDSIAGELGARPHPGTGGETGPVPPGNRRGGAGGGSDPDKPDLDRFAAKLGIDEPDPDGERAAEAAHEQVRAEHEAREQQEPRGGQVHDDPRDEAAGARADDRARSLVGTVTDVAGGLAGTGAKVALGAAGLAAGAAKGIGSRALQEIRKRT